MTKFEVFKKIVAFATAIALVVCFAVSASAVTVDTTTTYVGEDDADVSVVVTVGGLDASVVDYVTYYATKDAAPVHIDQEEVTDAGTATFEFYTAANNLKSEVLIGYTGADAAISGNTITGYTVSYSGGAGAAGSIVVPTEELTFAIPYTKTAGKVFQNVTLNSAEVAAVEGDGVITVTLTEALTGDIALVINEEDVFVPVPTATAEVLASAAINVTELVTENVYDSKGNLVENSDVDTAAVGNRKFTVIGQVAGATAYGIIVADNAIEDTQMDAAKFATYKAFEAKGKSDSGKFAIQLIDEATEAYELVTDTMYAAVYAFDGTMYSIAPLTATVE